MIARSFRVAVCLLAFAVATTGIEHPGSPAA
jgi:hypothetical protein